MSLITVFTPTYNRKKLLERLYHSLKRQTDQKFEWLIVDDGSTDDTKLFVDNIISESTFEIIYVYKKNDGKPSAHNKAVELCENDFILIVDSDDILTDNAIEVLNKKCEIIQSMDNVSGIIGNKGLITNKEKVIGNKMPDIEYASGLELYQKCGFKGETLRLYKTKILKEFLFPLIENEKFIPENVVFDKIDQHYKMLVIHEILYLCEYQETGLSSNIYNVRKNNPIGYSLSLKSTAETGLSFKKKVGVTILYILWNRKFRIKNTFKTFRYKFIYIVCVPISFLFQLLKRPKFYFNMFKESN